ncbi:MAG: sugar ABC transporter permease [Clostridia bacterium]|nr:sugar ABC transporter permease [Clostridia bacterium]
MKAATFNLKFKKPNKVMRRNLFIVSLLVVPIIHFLVFWVYLNAKTISLAFFEWDFWENTYKFVGLDNIKEQFRVAAERPEEWNKYLNAFRAIPINVACLCMAIVVGYAFSKHIWGERVFRIIFYLPSMISIVILTLCYRYMFTYSPGQLQGPAAELLRMLGSGYNGWEVTSPDHAVTERLWFLVSVFCVWASAGINIILVSSAMSRIPEEVKESAKLDGVGFWRELFTIDIPLIMPTIGVFLVNSMMAVTAFYLQPMLILDNTGSKSAFQTVGWYMFTKTTSAQNGDMPTISTVGLILTVIVSTLVIVVKKITDKLTPDVDF